MRNMKTREDFEQGINTILKFIENLKGEYTDEQLTALLLAASAKHNAQCLINSSDDIQESAIENSEVYSDMLQGYINALQN